MIAEPQKSGVFGEVFASRLLRENGYEILVANYRTKNGEIDLVARKDGSVSVIEVKTRRNDSFFSPSDAVDEEKQTNIKNTAADFLSKLDYHGDVSYDIIEVILSGGIYEIRHIKNAF